MVKFLLKLGHDVKVIGVDYPAGLNDRQVLILHKRRAAHSPHQ